MGSMGNKTGFRCPAGKGKPKTSNTKDRNAIPRLRGSLSPQHFAAVPSVVKGRRILLRY